MGKRTAGLAAPSKKIDPTLDALFAASSGPVQAPPKSRYSASWAQASREAPTKQSAAKSSGEGDDDDEDLSEASEELDYEDDEEDDDDDDGENEGDESMASSKEDDAVPDAETESPELGNSHIKKNEDTAEAKETKRERKRKRKDENDDLEDKYLSKLAEEEEEDAKPAEKRQKSDLVNEDSEGGENDKIPKHESLTKDAEASDLEKAGRTVFLANVSTTAIASKSDKKELLQHLSSILDEDASPSEKVESIRFRSVAFGGGSMPKRAAYITKQLMDATTKSTNAYAVYSTTAAARKAVAKLNGTEILGRHIRVDSVTHPTPTDHRRCVFVGNLGFVDDEAVLNTDEDGDTVKTKRNKAPSDIEEGLWRTFGKQGAVENVRVVRDPKTRVGKGFAYVQFYDENTVESALHLDGKRFPPMLPRILRVARAKDPRKTATAQERRQEKSLAASHDSKSTKYRKKLTPEELSMAGRAGRLLGRSAAAAQGRKARGTDRRGGFQPREGNPNAIKTPEQIVFEGTRASANNGRPKDLKIGGKKSRAKFGKPTGRAARRTAEWKQKQ